MSAAEAAWAELCAAAARLGAAFAQFENAKDAYVAARESDKDEAGDTAA